MKFDQKGQFAGHPRLRLNSRQPPHHVAPETNSARAARRRDPDRLPPPAPLIQLPAEMVGKKPYLNVSGS